jgi:hypothetical protein
VTHLERGSAGDDLVRELCLVVGLLERLVRLVLVRSVGEPAYEGTFMSSERKRITNNVPIVNKSREGVGVQEVVVEWKLKRNSGVGYARLYTRCCYQAIGRWINRSSCIRAPEMSGGGSPYIAVRYRYSAMLRGDGGVVGGEPGAICIHHS